MHSWRNSYSGSHLAHHAQEAGDLSGDLRGAAEDVGVVLLKSPHPRQPRQCCRGVTQGVRMHGNEESCAVATLSSVTSICCSYMKVDHALQHGQIPLFSTR